jgi:osmotically inducible lipoprotein OsmB
VPPHGRLLRGLTQTQQTTMKGGMVGAVGGVAVGAIAGNAALGMTVGRVAGMGVGYIYSKNQEGSD